MKFQLSIVFVLVVLATLVDLNSGLTRRQQVSFAKKAGGREEGDFCSGVLDIFPIPILTPCAIENTIENPFCCGPGSCCKFVIPYKVGICVIHEYQCK